MTEQEKQNNMTMGMVIILFQWRDSRGGEELCIPRSSYLSNSIYSFAMRKSCANLFGLIWWMVKSGEERCKFQCLMVNLITFENDWLCVQLRVTLKRFFGHRRFTFSPRLWSIRNYLKKRICGNVELTFPLWSHFFVQRNNREDAFSDMFSLDHRRKNGHCRG